MVGLAVAVAATEDDEEDRGSNVFCHRATAAACVTRLHFLKLSQQTLEP